MSEDEEVLRHPVADRARRAVEGTALLALPLPGYRGAEANLEDDHYFGQAERDDLGGSLSSSQIPGHHRPHKVQSQNQGRSGFFNRANLCKCCSALCPWMNN
jgi:hypothetical protein